MRDHIRKGIKILQNNNIEPSMLDISFYSSINVSDWVGESYPDESINVVEITIKLSLDENNDIVIGKARCYLLSGYDWVHDQFINLRDAADSMSGDLLTAVIPVTNEEGLIEDYIECDILYISLFYIFPDYRDKGIGQVVFPLIIEFLSRGVGVVVIIPCPTENNGKDRIESSDPRYNSIMEKMSKFISKYGFVQLDQKNHVWAKDTSLEVGI